jgi:anaerobic magnesium-protoporphyrin IX monomethyl ester cyclase
MKISFLIPPPLDGNKPAERVAGCVYGLYPIPNIFVLYVAAILESNGHKIIVEDFPINRRNEDDFIAYLRKDDSDIYFFYTVNLSKKSDLMALEMIRRYRSNVPIVYFGPSPSDKPEDFIVDNNCFVVRGEPEITSKVLVETIDRTKSYKNVEGITYLDGNQIRHNGPRPLIENLDELPFPARGLINRDKYYNPKLGAYPFTAAIASRNCPYRCIYCVPCSLSFAIEHEHKRFFNRKPPVRKRSPENVIEEFNLLKGQGYKSVGFQDDQFIWDSKRTIEICEGIKKTGLEWGCASRADHITEASIKAMAEANCKYIDLGVESFNQDVLDYIKKDMKVETIEKAVKIIKAHGICAKVNVLLGVSPLENKETIEYNKKRIKDLDIDQVMYSIANPFPGTEFYKIAKENNWLIYGDYVPSDVQKESIISYPSLTKEDLEKAVRKANREFFLDWKFIRKNLWRLKNPVSFMRGLKTVYRKLAK